MTQPQDKNFSENKTASLKQAEKLHGIIKAIYYIISLHTAICKGVIACIISITLKIKPLIKGREYNSQINQRLYIINKKTLPAACA